MRSSDWSSDVCSSDGWVFSKEIISCLTSDFSVDEQNIDSSIAKRHCLRGEVVQHMGYAVSHANRRFADLEIFVRVPASDLLDWNVRNLVFLQPSTEARQFGTECLRTV